MSEAREKCTLAGGCFWCLEAVYQEINGVTEVVSGYSGGTVPNPTYEQVCSGLTGHAETVQLNFDPEVVTYTDLLLLFFTMHDPTTLNRQGPDVGTEYRSVIFYHTESQRQDAAAVMADSEALVGVRTDKIVTELVPFETFYEAEEYHKNFYRRNSMLPYCQYIISPKVAKLRKEYLSLHKSASTTPISAH